MIASVRPASLPGAFALLASAFAMQAAAQPPVTATAPESNDPATAQVATDFSTVTGVADGDWITINRDPSATRHSPLTDISTDNVAQLAVEWSYGISGASTAVPLVVDGVMYMAAGDRVVALDGASGEEIWVHRLTGGPGARTSTRGVAWWPGDGDLGPRIVFTSGPRLVALDAVTGEPAAGFGENGAVNVGIPYGGVPALYRHVAIIGAAVGEMPQGASGNSRAFDVRSGELLWEFQTVPRAGEAYNHTWGDGWERRSGTNMWAFSATVDAERGIAYMSIASPSPNYYGGGRPGDNVYGGSIVAVDALSGERIWHFQIVRHDVWDVDMASVGTLFDFVLPNGDVRPAIAHVGKTSYLFVLDRETGEPLVDIEDRPVPVGDVPDEWYSPTQPFPVRPGPLSRVAFDPATDLVTAEDTSEAHVAACRQFIANSGGVYNAGPFTAFLYQRPDSDPRSTVQLPGGTGGVNWGGIALDPATGYLFVSANHTSLFGWLEDRDPDGNYGRGTEGSDQPYDRASILGPGPYASFSAPVSGEFDDAGRPQGPTLPCYRPPWAQLVAVDPMRGEIVWASTLGLNPNLPPDRQLVGNVGSAGPTVTAGGLVFVGATNDQRFRAFSTATGEPLWETHLSANANANPMSYRGRDGRQRVAIVAGNTVYTFGLADD